MNQIYISKVIRKEQISTSLVLFELELINPTDFFFKSGQYLAITLPDGKSIRAYSISSSELNKNKLELTINIFDRSLGGAGVDFLNSLNINDTVNFTGPYGKLTLEKTNIIKDEKLNTDVTEIIWIGTGSGIAPMKSMLEYLNYYSQTSGDEHLKNCLYRFYLGFRYSGDVCYFNELKKVEDLPSDFRFKYCLSKYGTSEDQGVVNIPHEYVTKGYVTEQILADNENMDKTKAQIFLCGKNSTLQSIMIELVNAGFKKENMHIENYG